MRSTSGWVSANVLELYQPWAITPGIHEANSLLACHWQHLSLDGCAQSWQWWEVQRGEGWGVEKGYMNHSVQLLREFFHLYIPGTCHRSGVGILHHSYTLSSQNSPLSLSASISETRCECPATMSGRKVCVLAFLCFFFISFPKRSELILNNITDIKYGGL